MSLDAADTGYILNRVRIALTYKNYNISFWIFNTPLFIRVHFPLVFHCQMMIPSTPEAGPAFLYSIPLRPPFPGSAP